MDKQIEVVIQKPVPYYKEIEVPYDVYIENPIEKVIERDVVT